MPDKTEEEKKKDEKPAPKDNLVESRHTIKIGGKEIKYTVTTGTIVLKEETPDREKESEGEKPRAQIFFIAYTKDGVKDKAKRRGRNPETGEDLMLAEKRVVIFKCSTLLKRKLNGGEG